MKGKITLKSIPDVGTTF